MIYEHVDENGVRSLRVTGDSEIPSPDDEYVTFYDLLDNDIPVSKYQIAPQSEDDLKSPFVFTVGSSDDILNPDNFINHEIEFGTEIDLLPEFNPDELSPYMLYNTDIDAYLGSEDSDEGLDFSKPIYTLDKSSVKFDIADNGRLDLSFIYNLFDKQIKLDLDFSYNEDVDAYIWTISSYEVLDIPIRLESYLNNSIGGITRKSDKLMMFSDDPSIPSEEARVIHGEEIQKLAEDALKVYPEIVGKVKTEYIFNEEFYFSYNNYIPPFVKIIGFNNKLFEIIPLDDLNIEYSDEHNSYVIYIDGEAKYPDDDTVRITKDCNISFNYYLDDDETLYTYSYNVRVVEPELEVTGVKDTYIIGQDTVADLLETATIMLVYPNGIPIYPISDDITYPPANTILTNQTSIKVSYMVEDSVSENLMYAISKSIPIVGEEPPVVIGYEIELAENRFIPTVTGFQNFLYMNEDAGAEVYQIFSDGTKIKLDGLFVSIIDGLVDNPEASNIPLFNPDDGFNYFLQASDVSWVLSGILINETETIDITTQLIPITITNINLLSEPSFDYYYQNNANNTRSIFDPTGMQLQLIGSNNFQTILEPIVQEPTNPLSIDDYLQLQYILQLLSVHYNLDDTVIMDNLNRLFDISGTFTANTYDEVAETLVPHNYTCGVEYLEVPAQDSDPAYNAYHIIGVWVQDGFSSQELIDYPIANYDGQAGNTNVVVHITLSVKPEIGQGSVTFDIATRLEGELH